MPKHEPLSTVEWQAVTKKQIFFGHQSVGENVLSGIRTLTTRSGATLPVTELPNVVPRTGIVHFRIGKNEVPLSKIRHFEDVIQSGIAQQADVALMKFCYLDVQENTDVKLLADAYISSIDSLSQRFPKTQFVAVTIPLTTVQSGVKAMLKQLLGRAPSGYAENARKQQFNNIIREKYAGKGLLFDLASVESEGTSQLQIDGASFETLNPAITSDGGHLNSFGEQIVATRFLKFIAMLPSKPH